MRYVGRHKAAKAAVDFLVILPKRYHDLRLYTLALNACASARDLESSTAVLELAIKYKFNLDSMLFTTFIKGGSSAIKPWHRIDSKVRNEINIGP